jgi:ankyrin repeat protein
VKLLLENGAEADWRDEYGPTPFLLAAESGHDAVVELLLKEQIDINSKDIIHGLTPLMWTCLHGHKTVAKLLLDKEANTYLTSSDCLFGFGPFGTALDLAAKYGHKSMIEDLLVHGADKDLVDGQGRTCLHYAAGGGIWNASTTY